MSFRPSRRQSQYGKFTRPVRDSLRAGLSILIADQCRLPSKKKHCKKCNAMLSMSLPQEFTHCSWGHGDGQETSTPPDVFSDDISQLTSCTGTKKVRKHCLTIQASLTRTR